MLPALLTLTASAAPDTVRVAAVQMASVMGNVDGNLDRAEALVREAAAGGAVFVVLPEAAVSGYLSQDLSTNWMGAGLAAGRFV